MAQASRDQNFVPTLLAVSSVDGRTPVVVYANPTTHRLLTDLAGGSGTVQTVSVATANGFAGTSDGDPTNPTLTLTTTVTGIIKGNGTSMSAATAGTDYVTASSVNTFTNKTYDTAGTGNSFSINGVAVTANTGTGAVARATSPTFVTPVLGAATATSINGLTITSSTGTFTLANAKVLTVSNTLTFTGTDGSSVAFGTGGTVLYTTSAIPLTVGTTTITSGTNTKVLFDNSGVLGEYTISGSGNVAMTTSPSFTTPVLGTPTSGNLSNCTNYPLAQLTGAGTGVLTFLATPSSANLASAVTDETGSGALVFANTPTLVTPVLGAATATSVTSSGANQLSAGSTINILVPTSGGTSTGPTTNSFNSGYTSTAVGDLVYLDSSTTWQKADADASATTYSGFLGIAMSVTASGAAATVALPGSMIFATAWNLATVGAPVYMSATAGAITLTAPTTTDSATRVIGWVLASGNGTTKIWFQPSPDFITHT